MITPYHGSNVEIERIDLSRSKKGKDFGRGFYLNANRQQALDMAERTAKRLAEGKATINAYTFDVTVLMNPNNLRIKIFDDYSEEWARFVLMNRKNVSDTPAHDYDIVVGPIANDTVGVQIRRFIMGYIDMDKLVEELRFRGNHSVQYFFATEAAVAFLNKIKI